MSNDNKTLADVQPGGRVRLGDSRSTRAATFLRQYLTYLRSSPRQGLRPRWCDVYEALEIAIEALSAQPSPGGQDALDCIGRIEEAIEFRVPHDIYAAVHGELAELKAALAARQPVGEPVGYATFRDGRFGSWLFQTRAMAESHDSTAVAGGPANSEIVPLFRSPAQAVDLVQEPMFYIQDTRQFVGNCPAWWGPNGSGYVTRLDEAGRYTEQEAVKQNRCRDTDIPWPCAEIDAIARPTVDFQHMRPRAERLAELALIDSHSAGGQP